METNVLDKLKSYKSRLSVERMMYGMDKLKEFKDSMPEELAEVFQIEPTSIFANARGINANVTVGEVNIVLTYHFAQNLYTAQFERCVDVTGETSEWTSEQTFEELVDYILHVAKKDTRRLC